MQYRKFGKLDWQVSALGFGAMRLPLLDDDQANINEPETTRMIRYAIDHGVNYVDAAYPYHAGKCEGAIGRALQDGYRDKVKLATKLPSWLIESYADFDRYLNEQLERLQTDKIEFYLLHNMTRDFWPKLRDMDVMRWVERIKSDARIDHLGFSFHDDFDVFKGIIDEYDGWDFCQIQYNYMDIDYQAGTRGLEYAADKGLAVVVMEPLRGGRLSKKPPENIAKLWATAAHQRSPADWALSWVWDHPEVTVVLSGMTTMPQVVENIEIADRSGPNTLTAEELALIDQVQVAYQELGPIPCTSCGYCLPCSSGVKIPLIFEIYNDSIMYNEPQSAKAIYDFQVKEDQRADKCTECGECLEACPQDLPIPEWLKTANGLLSKNK